MDINFYLRKVNDNNEYKVIISIAYDSNRFFIYTKEKLNKKYWNDKTQRVRTNPLFGDYKEFNRALDQYDTIIKDCFRKYLNEHDQIEPPESVFKSILKDRFSGKKQSKLNLYQFIDKVIDESEFNFNLKTGKKLSKGTIKHYKRIKNRLLEYEASRNIKLDFSSITLDFYYDYVKYKEGRDYALNSIGDDIKLIKSFMNEAFERGLHTNTAYKSSKFKKIQESADSVYLNQDELNEIYSLELKDHLDSARDLFLVGCYTGLRFSDFSTLTKSNIKDKFIDNVNIKTGTRVVIPILPVLREIINKYSDQPNSLPHKLSNQKLNNHIKEICSKIDSLNKIETKTTTIGGTKRTRKFRKWELISTHTARRSFATNNYKKGVPAITIMQITGHKTEKAFLAYIKVTPDEHAKIMQSYWF